MKRITLLRARLLALLFLATHFHWAVAQVDSQHAAVCAWKEHEAALLAAAASDQATRADLMKLYREFSAKRLGDKAQVDGNGLTATPEERVRWLAASKAIAAADKEGRNLVFPLLLRCGWPDAKVIDQKAVDAVWLVLQHANLEAQLQFQGMAEQAVRDKLLAPAQFAILIDRMLIRQGRPQLYGSQLGSVVVGGLVKTTLLPTEDLTNVDRRRASVGLGSLCDYIRGFPDLRAEEVYASCK